MNLFGLVFIAAGFFSICGAIFDWDFFMNSRKARFMVSIFGREGARIFYGLLGAGIVIFGAMRIVGMVKNAS